MRAPHGVTIVAGVALIAALPFAMESLGAPVWAQRSPPQACAMLGALAAALSFDRGDPPRRGWGLIAVTLALALMAGPILAAERQLTGAVVGPLFIALANLSLVGGVLLLLRALRASGLGSVSSRGWRVGAAFGAALSLTVAAVIVGDVANSADSLAWSIRRIVGVAADVIVFNAAIQMIRITLPMLGGSVARPFYALAAGAALFMVVDVALAVESVLWQVELTAPLRIVDGSAWGCLAFGGLLQMLAIRGAGR